MAHEFETGFFVRTPAWHKLGTVLETAPSVKEGIHLAGLDWEVEKRPLYLAGGIEVPDRMAVVRKTDDQYLGTVGRGWTPLQNSKAFNFFEPFVLSGLCQLDTAGSLKEGRRIFVLAKLRGASAQVVDGDAVNGYFLLSNSHDGTSAVRAQFTSIRVVCWNTLSLADGKADSGAEDCIRVRHTAGVEEGLALVQRTVDMAEKTFRATIADYQRMVSKNLPVDGLEKYVREVLRAEDETAKTPKAFDEILAAYEHGPGAKMKGVYGTFWGAYNAVTDWVDHARGGRKGDAQRLDQAWFGMGVKIKERAYELALN